MACSGVKKRHRPNFRLPPNNIFSGEVVGHYRVSEVKGLEIFVPRWDFGESLWAWESIWGSRAPMKLLLEKQWQLFTRKGRPLPASRTSTENAPQWIDNGHVFRALKVFQSCFFGSNTSACQCPNRFTFTRPFTFTFTPPISNQFYIYIYMSKPIMPYLSNDELYF